MKKILLAAPLKQKPYIFEEYQKSIDRLIIPEGYSLDRFYVINNCEEIIPYMHSCTYSIVNSDDVQDAPHIWKSNNILKMIKLRNLCFEAVLNDDYDYIFSVDTDLVLHPQTLEVLLAHKTDIVAEAFWTNSDIGLWYNGLKYINWEGYDHAKEENRKAILDMYNAPGATYQVAMAGACILISRKVLEAGVTYDEIPGLWSLPNSEDKNFCIRAACAGFPIYLDTRVRPVHLFDDEKYNEYMASIGSYKRAPVSQGINLI